MAFLRGADDGSQRFIFNINRLHSGVCTASAHADALRFALTPPESELGTSTEIVRVIDTDETQAT